MAGELDSMTLLGEFVV